MPQAKAGRARRKSQVAAVGICVVLAVAAAVLFTVGAPVYAAEASPGLGQPASFPDVDSSLPAYDAIGLLSAAGVISGYADGRFGPGDTLTRGQATKMLVLWREIPLVTGKSTFPDLDDTYRNYVETACAQGWITGFVNGRFKPYECLTRQQMAIIMVRVMGWEQQAKALTPAQVEEVLQAFSDQARISDVARPYVAVAVTQGLFAGSGGRFLPREGITRAQFCLVLYRAELTLRAVVQGIRFCADYPDKTRVVVDLSRAPEQVVACASPDGVLNIDYLGGLVVGQMSTSVGSREVGEVSASQLSYKPRTVRLSFRLGAYQSFRIMSLGPSEGYGNRIAVDVFRRTDGPETDGPPLICVDAGHGGNDPGAIGVDGTPEKAVNLAIALKLADVLRSAGLRVMLTREDDRFVPLADRADMANNARATVFVSIHNNASGSGNAGASGTETYYRGTSDLPDLESRKLALLIQSNLVTALGSKDRGAKTHWVSLVVLTDTVMPAALVEVGFMDNAEEEAKLLTPEYQQAAAQAIAKGIMQYLGWSTDIYTEEQ